MEPIDPGIVGVSYQAPMVLQDAENCINWYVEIAEVGSAKMPVALLGTPGLNYVISDILGEVRGLWVLPGGAKALVVVGNQLYLATIPMAGKISLSPLGYLLTGAGPVSIRDNGNIFGGEGGYAVIVDGQFGYYWSLSNATQHITFTGGVTATDTTVTVSSIPNGLVAGDSTTISDTAGDIPANTLFTGVDFNSVVLNMSKAATGTNASDTITITIPAFGRITDPAFLPASRVAFIEGWLIFSQPGTRTFFSNAATPYTLLFSGLFYALKDSSTDNLISLQENIRELWLIGERTSEVWYQAGGGSFAFARIPGIGPQVGCAATASLSRLGEQLVWLAKNEQGENFVVRQQQYSWERISNHAIENAIAKYAVTSDAIGYCYEEDGHFFYVLTFPTADVTWCYDATASARAGKPCWHQRASLDSEGVYHRHRSNCYMDFGGMRIVGDYQNGQILQMSRQFYTDNGAVLRAQRRSPHVWAKPSRNRMFYSWMQFEFTPGVGLQSGQGSNPQMMLRWSSDGGFTWSQEVWLPIGMAGQTRNRAVARRLGYAYDRVWEVNISDPVPRDLIGATLFAEEEISL